MRPAITAANVPYPTSMQDFLCSTQYRYRNTFIFRAGPIDPGKKIKYNFWNKEICIDVRGITFFFRIVDLNKIRVLDMHAIPKKRTFCLAGVKHKFFFYKNLVYKNAEAKILPRIKNDLS